VSNSPTYVNIMFMYTEMIEKTVELNDRDILVRNLFKVSYWTHSYIYIITAFIIIIIINNIIVIKRMLLKCR